MSLKIETLDVSYGAVAALQNVEITAEGGQILAIIGANGAGKSTLLKTIAGSVRKTSGKIELDGEEISQKSIQQRVREGIALVPEGRQVWSALTVEEHLRLGWFATKKDRAGFRDGLAYIYELFPVLVERRKQMAGTLSGGEQQMLAIGRALILQPRVLLLDEPTLGLAPIMMDRVAESLAKTRSSDRIVIVAEQNAHFVLALADRGYVFELGRQRIDGTSDELRNNPELIDSYLGTVAEL